jgi:hypothetical protein
MFWVCQMLKSSVGDIQIGDQSLRKHKLLLANQIGHQF